MSIVNYILTAILGMGWVIGFFGFNPGREVHILLVLALVVVSAVLSRKKLAFKNEELTKNKPDSAFAARETASRYAEANVGE
jgi:hypothetical protein